MSDTPTPELAPEQIGNSGNFIAEYLIGGEIRHESHDTLSDAYSAIGGAGGRGAVYSNGAVEPSSTLDTGAIDDSVQFAGPYDAPWTNTLSGGFIIDYTDVSSVQPMLMIGPLKGIGQTGSGGFLRAPSNGNIKSRLKVFNTYLHGFEDYALDLQGGIVDTSIFNCIMQSNPGGIIRVQQDNALPNVTRIDHCTLRTSGDNGNVSAVVLEDGKQIDLLNTLVESNFADGVEVNDVDFFTMDNCWFENNARNTGGFAADFDNCNVVSMTNIRHRSNYMRFENVDTVVADGMNSDGIIFESGVKDVYINGLKSGSDGSVTDHPVEYLGTGTLIVDNYLGPGEVVYAKGANQPNRAKGISVTNQFEHSSFRDPTGQNTISVLGSDAPTVTASSEGVSGDHSASIDVPANNSTGVDCRVQFDDGEVTYTSSQIPAYSVALKADSDLAGELIRIRGNGPGIASVDLRVPNRWIRYVNIGTTPDSQETRMPQLRFQQTDSNARSLLVDDFMIDVFDSLSDALDWVNTNVYVDNPTTGSQTVTDAEIIQAGPLAPVPENVSFVRANRGTASSSTTSGTFINIFDGESKDNLNEFNGSQQFSPHVSGEYVVNCVVDFRGNTTSGSRISFKIRNTTDSSDEAVLEDRTPDAFSFMDFTATVNLDSSKTYEFQATNHAESFVIGTEATVGTIRSIDG